ncbi:hypothetical protein E4T48_00499 [Aureobasidium sp. EXF-10727]|nr:hypothetical protein E4T48_00499 [Aureobasidium sp. EXF-10727]KAI4729764.1 hypothetical protein E4T49_02552 [Aureobasidium sp. EXF-10728]
MVVARQEPPWAARSSYYASLYSAQQAAQTASPQVDDADQDKNGQQLSNSGYNDQTGSAFSTATDLAFGATTATLEDGTTATTMTSTSDPIAQSLTSDGALTPGSTLQTTAVPSMTTSISWTQTAWRSGWHSPSYTSTSTPSETSPASLAPGLNIQDKAHHGLHTTLVAGVVVPIVIILAGGLVALTCLRRRRKRATPTNNEDAQVTEAAAPISMVEKVAAKKTSADGHRLNQTTMLSPIDEATAAPQLPQLVITSSQNATYFTGLDTFSVHSAATTEDPPPPYRARSMLSHTSSERRQPSIVTQSAALAPISPVSPISPVTHLASPFSDANAIAVARSPSQRSFASTLYSSNASVYEARPARRSTGPAEYVVSRRSSTDDQMRVRSPFEDPEDEFVGERSERS